MSKNKKDYSLDLQIILAPFDNFIFNERKKMQKEVKKSLKRTIIGITPSIVGVIGFIISANPIFFVVGAGVSGLETIGMMVNDILDDQKEVKEQVSKIIPEESEDISNKNIVNMDELSEEKDFNPYSIKEPSEFYTTEFKTFIEKNGNYKPSEEQIKYDEALKKQQEKIQSKEINYNSKEESIMEVVDYIEKAYLLYNLPPLDISDYNYDVFFDCLYNFCVDHGIEKSYYNILSFIVSMTLADSLTREKKVITIFDFIEYLRLLEEREGIKMYHVMALKKEIVSKLTKQPVVNINDYKKQKN